MTTLPFKALSGIILIIGSLAFLVAAFMPISRVFAARTAEQRLAILEADRPGWLTEQFLFASGAAIAWIGMTLLAYRLRIVNGSTFALIAAAAAGAGLLFWFWHVYLRATSPQDFANSLLPGWHFLVYAFLTLFAMFAIGMGMRGAHFPTWLPILNMGAAVLFALILLIFKDIPPLAFYLVTLVDGIALLLLKNLLP